MNVSSLPPGRHTLNRVLRTWAELKADEPCLISEGGSRSWRETYERACRLANALIADGVGPGDRVVFLGRNRVEYFELVLASALCGAVAAGVNWRLAPRELAAIIGHSEAKVVIVESEFLAKLDASVGDDSLSRVVTLCENDAVGCDDGLYEKWLVEFPAADPDQPVEDAQEVLQLYTSGTTGLPKGATFSHRAVWSASEPAATLGIGGDSVVMVAMPVFHASGSSLGLIALCAGAATVVARDADPRQLLRLMSAHRVTATTLVPEVLRRMLSVEELDCYDLSSLNTVTYAGSPVSPELVRQALQRLDCRLVQVYGMTEVNGITVLGAADHLDRRHPERLASVGVPMPGVTLRIVDPSTGLDVNDGEVGEIWVRSPTVMSGYWRDPIETDATLMADGFLRTGDGGFRDGGYLYLRDRIKDMIVTGGENVYSAEVENVLRMQDGIDDVAVIGIPSERWGETVLAVVVRDPSAPQLTESDVISHARGLLASYKCPTVVEFVGVLPRNESGKVRKNVLRQTYRGGKS